MTTTELRQALDIARVLLRDRDPVTSEDLTGAIERAAVLYPGVSRQLLLDELERSFNVWVGPGTNIENNEDHIPWLEARRAEIRWDFWRRYELYLEQEVGLPPSVISNLDRLTDDVLGRLEDPARRPGPWDRRGMVVGHVQSGKTSNYTALICKAADAGYKLIIVLAGRHNSLRSQTQLRIDEGFLGYDTQVNRAIREGHKRIGVGALRGVAHPHADSLTTSADNGDFLTREAARFAGHLGNIPIILVVKKVKSILESLNNWCAAQEAGRSLPLLVIDDEADDASINTRAIPLDEDGRVDPDHDVTAINGSIRKLLHSFDQSAYVAYTATPFANIFIQAGVNSERHGEDLFPRSFITNLPAPSNYVGPARVFGVGDGAEPLNMVRPATGWREWMPDQHKKDHRPGELPASLKEAVRTFVLSCAARYARGQTTVHNSMLVHVTRFTAVQNRVAEQLQDELDFLVRRIRRGDEHAQLSIRDELQALWMRDFVPGLEQPLGWDAVHAALLPAADKIRVKTINGTAADTLEYYEKRNVGVSVIAVGGDKLSRGLTLEGLSVSYYLRASRMYDTLMQMGRWFGYRPGYLDLCRLYTTPDLIDWYTHVTFANEELRREFDDMAARGMTPQDYGLRVRTHPAGLTVTAVNKMRSGTKMRVSFAGSISETVGFHRDAARNAHNRQAMERFLQGLPGPRPEDTLRNRVLWRNVPAAEILTLLDNLTVHEGSRRARPELLARYIEQRQQDGELTDWTVALVSNSTRVEGTLTLAGQEVGWLKRTAMESSGPGQIRLRRLVSPTDEQIDLNAEQLEEARELTLRNWQRSSTRTSRSEPTVPSGEAIRSVRKKRNGLLLLYPVRTYEEGPDGTAQITEVMGFAISFPDSRLAQTVEYVVNNVYWETEFIGA
ncbi:Z1 domain-containing protein [Deinococcus hopiensis]|uniref:Z1 domain-containing protein n=1 Tax=Deinococcus hopiensis KR-140 TaxID=695939 RepID=A0A1W1UM50_9DEIO|nr:Z1 domain-containing protein [Deinococcus hopiensis]SMB82176.1 Z1 domain-containing protein [Deinococcus hopiensis KR-140]